jgi:CRISPR-associated protein Csm2
MSAIKTIIQKDQPELLVGEAKKLGEGLAQAELTTNQIRNVFGQVRQIEHMWRIPAQRAQAERLLLLLKPRMAYQAAKEDKSGVKKMVETLTEAIDAVFENAPPAEREPRFRRFTELFEAVLAYHRAAVESRKGNQR